MTPEQKIKWQVINVVSKWKKVASPSIDENNVDDLYQDLVDTDQHWDALSEIRQGSFETNLECEYSRHYESKAVASKMPDGSYVGWTYWYGGGKHSNPDEIDWIEFAYDVDCVEEEKTITVRTFTRI